MPRRLSFRRRQPKPAASDRPARLLRLRRTGVGQAATRLAALILRRDKAPRPDRARASDPLRLTARLFAIGFIACMLQLLVVAQIGVFGVTAELAPLVVAAAGFLCGSLAGACFGFGVGLFIDLAFVQVLGISSLLFTRDRLRRRAAARAAGARGPDDAPRSRGGGDGAVARRLRRDRVHARRQHAGQLRARRRADQDDVLNSLIALPVYALTRRSLLAALPAGSERDDESRRDDKADEPADSRSDRAAGRAARTDSRGGLGAASSCSVP